MKYFTMMVSTLDAAFGSDFGLMRAPGMEHTAAQAEVIDNNTVILEQKGKKVQMEIATNAASAKVYVADAVPLLASPTVEGQSKNAGIKKVVVSMQEAGDVFIQMKLTPLGDLAAQAPMEVRLIDQWRIPDGEIMPLPMLDGIQKDGAPLPGFEGGVSDYAVNVPYSLQGVPDITASAGDGLRVEVTKAGGLGDATTIRVSETDNPERYRVYRISFRVIPLLPEVGGMTRYPVVDVRASMVPEVENSDMNIVDGNIETRWSAEGPGQWVQIELDRAHCMILPKGMVLLKPIEAWRRAPCALPMRTARAGGRWGWSPPLRARRSCARAARSQPMPPAAKLP